MDANHRPRGRNKAVAVDRIQVKLVIIARLATNAITDSIPQRSPDMRVAGGGEVDRGHFYGHPEMKAGVICSHKLRKESNRCPVTATHLDAGRNAPRKSLASRTHTQAQATP